MSKVAPKLFCGLGNRIFQTMAAIGKAEQTNATPVFFLPRSSQEHGDFELIFKLFPSLPVLETAATWQETQDPDTIQTESLLVLSGFFQDTKFFPSLENPHWPRLPDILPEQDSWAAHFRFGDYQKLKHYHVDLSRYYYYVLKSNVPKGSRVTLFSDSPERLSPIAKEIESLGYQVTIFKGSPLETLKAFASCVKGICSNSTFAWWAAYFAWRQNRDYKAYFPNRWLVNEPPINLNLPFTQSIDLDSINAEPALLTFSHS